MAATHRTRPEVTSVVRPIFCFHPQDRGDSGLRQDAGSGAATEVPSHTGQARICIARPTKVPAAEGGGGPFPRADQVARGVALWGPDPHERASSQPRHGSSATSDYASWSSTRSAHGLDIGIAMGPGCRVQATRAKGRRRQTPGCAATRPAATASLSAL